MPTCRSEIRLISITLHTIWIKDLNVKHWELSEENIDHTLHDKGVRKDFLIRTPFAH